ncbi:MAG: hypothetical protein OHK0022_24020 [Roseiflexaceae bacterium]
MSSTATQVVTDDRKPLPLGRIGFDAFLAWADEDTHAEWVDGEVIMASPASAEHQQIALFLVRVLAEYLDERPLGQVFVAPFTMRLGTRPSAREPDLLVLLNEHNDRLKATYLDGPADIVIEIISPESDSRDRGEKFVEYEAGAVREYWLIDPVRRAATFYQLDAEQRYQAIPLQDGVYRSAALTGFWFRVDWLWDRPRVRAVIKELGLP